MARSLALACNNDKRDVHGGPLTSEWSRRAKSVECSPGRADGENRFAKYFQVSAGYCCSTEYTRVQNARETWRDGCLPSRMRKILGFAYLSAFERMSDARVSKQAFSAFVSKVASKKQINYLCDATITDLILIACFSDKIARFFFCFLRLRADRRFLTIKTKTSWSSEIP